MHFFIDHVSLPVQAVADGYGPALGSPQPDQLYYVAAAWQLTGARKAFACQDGAILVTPHYTSASGTSVNTNLVNIILKPNEGLKIAFPAVKYYIYRGIEKNTLFNGADLVATGPSVAEVIRTQPRPTQRQ
jgi:hypothetical protein